MKEPSGRKRIRPRRLLLLFLFVLVGGLIISSLGAGRNENQLLDENQAYGELYNGNPTQDCWRHHRGEGMFDSHVIIPIVPQAIEVGVPRAIQLQVENAWKYTISELSVSVGMPEDENGQTHIATIGGTAGEASPPLKISQRGTLGNPNVPSPPPPAPSLPPSNATVTVPVQSGAIALFAQLELYYPEANAPGVVDEVEAVYYTPGASLPFQMDPREDNQNTRRNLTLPKNPDTSDPILPTPGDWRFEFTYTGGDPPTVDYFFNVTVLYEVRADTEVFSQLREPPFDPATRVVPTTLIDKRGVSDVIEVPIIGLSPGVQVVEIRVRALLWYAHQDGRTPNEDWFTRVARVPISVGAEYVPSTVGVASAGVLKNPLLLEAGELTGFSSAFLLLPSLLFGGTYGRGSRKFFNLVLGGAKRRVMFHNLMSLGLTLTALVHIVFFLLEVRYGIVIGVLWGGLGALSLLVLGLTGYYQVPLIQRYGYNWWRAYHLVVGLLVVVFVAYHTIADGTHFNFIKQELPAWLNDINLKDPSK